MTATAKTFSELYGHELTKNVNHLEKEYKDKKSGEIKSYGLSYLNWATALKVLSEMDPAFDWEIREWNGAPWLDLGPDRGGMVYVTVTLFGKKRGSFLAIMDPSFDPIPNPDAWDIDYAHKRCLVKAAAMHGFGLSLYEKTDDKKTGGGAKAPQMAAGENNAPVAGLALTMVKSLGDMKGYGVKGLCANDAGEEIKVTFWKREVTAPAIGEKVVIDGVWEISEHGNSITAKVVKPFGAPLNGEGAGGNGAGEKKTFTLAEMKGHYAKLCLEARALEIPFKKVPDSPTAEQMTELGKELRAKIVAKSPPPPPPELKKAPPAQATEPGDNWD